MTARSRKQRDDNGPVRVLVANEDAPRLEEVSANLERAGAVVVAQTVDVEHVIPLVIKTLPDVAVVSVGPSAEHAVSLIEEIVSHAVCAVVALIHGSEHDFTVAADHGAFAVITDRDPGEWLCALHVACRRYAQYNDLRGAFSRRAIIERANGILMERHGLTADEAFSMLRQHSRRNNLKLNEVASAIVAGHGLLPPIV